MSNGKRVTRDMRIKFLDMHNKLKNMCNMIEETADCNLSDVRNLREAVCTLHGEFDFAPASKQSYYWGEWVLKEDVKEETADEEVEEHG